MGELVVAVAWMMAGVTLALEPSASPTTAASPMTSFPTVAPASDDDAGTALVSKTQLGAAVFVSLLFCLSVFSVRSFLRKWGKPRDSMLSFSESLRTSRGDSKVHIRMFTPVKSRRAAFDGDAAEVLSPLSPLTKAATDSAHPVVARTPLPWSLRDRGLSPVVDRAPRPPTTPGAPAGARRAASP